MAADMMFVKDINTLAETVGGTPSEFVQVGTTMYFTASGNTTGLELWKTDGTPSGTMLVKDIRSGATGSALNQLTNVNGTLFFSANNGTNGSELWKTDGTAEGTVLVRDIRTGTQSSNPSNLVNVGGTLFFSANDGNNGTELWKSDGTTNGTVLVRNVRAGNASSTPANLTEMSGAVYFTANDGTNGVELWRSDGTNAGTTMVRNIRTGVASATPTNLVNVNGTLFFSANDGTNGVELWSSNGTSASTIMVRNIFAGATSSNPTQLTNIAGTLYFAANEGTGGIELWKSDGTNAGTQRVADIFPGITASNPTQLTAVGTSVYFAAQNASGIELWKSDGTAAGTQLVRDIQAGAGNSNPSNLKNINGTLYFAADNGVLGTELWKSDGTLGGTILVSDIRVSNNLGSNPSWIAAWNGQAIFQANDGLTGAELWISNGTAEGTSLLKEIRPESLDSQIGPEIVTVGANYFFTATDGINGVELWKSNGTAEGTVMVKDINPGALGSAPTYLTDVGGILYFVADDGINGSELWKSDGTEAGTVLVKDIALGAATSEPIYLTNVNGSLYFAADNITNGMELWKTDGTDAGTVMVKDIYPGTIASLPNNLTDVNGTLYFVASDIVGGTELWKSDGTDAGTVRVKDIRTGFASGLDDHAGITNVGGTIFFTATTIANGTELWKSDGTEAGTVMVKDISPGPGSSYAAEFALAEGVLFFTATDGVNGYELWKSDGTETGTVMVRDIIPGTLGSEPEYITAVGGKVFFFADDGVNGSEPWVSDGTAEGTMLLKDINPGLGSNTPSPIVDAQGIAYFVADDSVHGPELWQSDGTPEGTFRTTTVTSAPIGTAPTTLGTFRGSLVFAAVDGIHGSELWGQIPNAAPTDILLSENSVPENSVAPTTIGVLSSIDRDVDDTFTYTLVPGTDDLDNASFEIIGTNLNAKNSFDFETKPTYSLRIRSTDLSGLFTEKVFVINVTNVNEAPTDIALASSTITENAGVNAPVGTLNTTDLDPANTFTYSLVAGTGDADNAAFNLNGELLQANSSFDYETKSSYSVRIRSTDQDGLFTEKVFIINVLNVNEAPTDISISSSTIEENSGVNATVGTLSTSDADAANTFSYELIAGTGDTDNSAFNISGNVLRASTNLDFETKSSYSVRVRSTDQSGLFVEKIFTITATNAAEAPTDVLLSSSTIAENLGANALIGTFSTVDSDLADTHSYSFATGEGDTDNAAFALVGNELHAVSNLDFETKSTYLLRIRSTDSLGLFFEKAFTINVVNANENPTDIVISSTALPENAGPNAVVGTLSTLDVDVSDSFTYALVAGTGDSDNTAFNISGNQLRANNSFDYETKSSYSVRLRSTDQGGLSTEKVFVISVTDINEAPTDLAISSTSIVEDSGIDATVGTFSTTDDDAGNTFTYSLVAGAGDTDNAEFHINANELRATANLNFAAKSSYSVRVRSTDQGGLSIERSFTIQVLQKNVAPSNLELTPSFIFENSGANAVVGALSTSDANAGDTFTYTLAPGLGDADNAAFNIDAGNLRATDNLDYETRSSYSVRLRTTDQDGLSFEKVFIVNVLNRNEAPTDVILSTSTVAEGLAINTIVGLFATFDADSANSFTYSLVNGAGDTDNAAFNVSGNALRTSESFDFETKSTYTIRIRSTDQGGLFTEKSFVIGVTDVNETPTDIGLSNASIPENSGANASVGTLSTIDSDTGNTYVYSLVTGTGDVDNTAFNIVGDELRATNNLVFATQSTYTVRIRSTDQGGLFTEKSFIINVTDVNHAPTDILLKGSSLPENAGSNASIGDFSATDSDVGDSFIFTLVTGTGDSDNESFNIAGNTLRATASLDFEAKSAYTIRVRATDAGGLTTEKSFVISVLNVNETPVDISINTNAIDENAGANAVVGGLSTIDPDSGNTFSYTLANGTGDTDNAAFNIDGSNLRASSSFDFETKSSYTVRIRSTDQDGLFTEKAFIVSVNDVNEAPTDIALSKNTIDENSGANASIGNLTTSDVDVGNTFTYALVAGTGDTDNATFNISGATLRATTSLDFETKSSYSVRLRSTDQNGLFVDKVFLISVNDVNEAPTDVLLSKNSIPENSGVNAIVGTLSSVDSDASNTFTYSLVAGNGDTDNSAFNISGNSLRASINLSFATQATYSVRIRTTDQGGLSVDKSFVINVLQVNNAPTDISITSTTISENLGANATVGSLSTTDSNAGDTFTYSLVAGAGDVDNAAFNINGNVLRVTNNLDFETKASYTVRIRSTDQGGLFTEKAFVINVTDAPEEIYLPGTAGNDAFVANYTGDGVQAQWIVTRNGTVVFSGVVPAGQNLWIDGLAGTDSIQVVGRAVDDILTLDANRIAVNGAWIRNTNIESFRLSGGNGNDTLKVISGTAFFDGGAGTDRLEATTGLNTFNIAGSGAGNLNNTVTFTAVESLLGGTDDDRFVFGANGRLVGQVLGGAGADTIDLSAKTTAHTLNLTTNMLTSTGGIFDVESFIGGTSTTDTVIAPNTDNKWNVTGVNQITLNTIMSLSGFENVTGGTAVDRFDFGPAGRITGTLTAGTGTDVASFAAVTTPIQVQLGTAPLITGLVGRYVGLEIIEGNGIAGSRVVGANTTTAWTINASGGIVVSGATFNSIPTIAAGTAADTLTGPTVSTRWNLDAANAGSVSVGTVAVTFSGIENLTGSTGNDEFIIAPTGTLSGNLNGGTGTGINSVDYSAWTTGVTVNLSTTNARNATAINGAMTSIAMVTGGAGNDSLTGRATLTTILIGLAGNDVLIGGSQRDILIGGSGADILHGAAGDDLLISGTTSYDLDRAALLAIHSEWISARTFAQRTSNLFGTGTGARANGTTFLNNAADSVTDTVFADTDTDILTGGTNQDWFFAALAEITDPTFAGTTPDRRD